MWPDCLVFYDYGFSLSAFWCPLSAPTVLLGFLLPWMWDFSSQLLSQRAATAPDLEPGVTPLGCSSAAQRELSPSPRRSINSELKWTGQSWAEKNSHLLHSKQQTWLSLLDSAVPPHLTLAPDVSLCLSIVYSFSPRNFCEHLACSRTGLHSYLSPKRTPSLEKTSEPGPPYL